MTGLALDQQRILIQALQDCAVFDHPVRAVRVLETHISWVLLTGEFAYKLKKAVNFGFLDFSTLAKRRFYCQEEIRLNRCFAPELYIDVVTITGTASQPLLRGVGEPLEYAVRMRQFPQTGLLSNIAGRHELSSEHIDEIIGLLAGIHASAGIAGVQSDFGRADDIQGWVIENFRHIRPALPEARHAQSLDRLENWCRQAFTENRSLMQSRRQEGFIRECHGDLHLGNLTLVDGRITPFDCIEFNPKLRWIDVMSEAAFLMMDIQDRGYPGLAFRFMNGYLHHTGDYAGVRLLRYYLVYRALVRAKVAVLRFRQDDIAPDGKKAAWQECQAYMKLASHYMEGQTPALVATHGVSGTGKSWYAGHLAERLGAIQIRSDVERKRLYGYRAGADTGSGVQSGIYSAAASERTYARLETLAQSVIEGGYPVIVDAAFLKHAERDRFRQLAVGLGVPFALLHFTADQATLHRRLRQRQGTGTDPSEAGIEVLEAQLASQEPLLPEEMSAVIAVETSGQQPVDSVLGQLARRLDMPEPPSGGPA